MSLTDGLANEIEAFEKAHAVLSDSNTAAKRVLTKLRETIPSIEKWEEATQIIERLYTCVLIQNSALSSMNRIMIEHSKRLEKLESDRS